MIQRGCSLLAIITLLAAAAFADDLNVNWTRSDRRSSCNDLKVEALGREVARAEQQFSMAQGEVTGVSIKAARNGGVHVYGWSEPRYEVAACKVAIGENATEAQNRLSQLRVTNSRGTITAEGPGEPDDHNRNWMVYFIVRAPKNATLSAEAYNGPVSVYQFSGKLTARSHNGPISLKHTTGEVTGETHNGPVDFTGNTGTVSLKTENGPLSLKLDARQWTSGTLTASTHNGPVQLRVPEEFESAFLLQGGHGPLGCRGAICEKTTRDNRQGSRKIEFGSSPIVKATTQNGPVTVDVLRGEI